MAVDLNQYAEGIRWYVVHTYSGYENKVKTNLEKIVENRGLQDLIYDIKIPTETVIEGEGEDRKEVEVKLFPSYVMVKMIMNDKSWHAVRNITGVTGFVGPGSAPVPLSDAEVEALGVERSDLLPKLGYNVGDNVRIIRGAMKDFIGRVDEISPDCKKIKVLASLFGRETPVELDADDVELYRM
ncbi:MAG: transcription termination/antitermination factor NusG [Clostridia bacterium]|nr:transcription termination/antitermination factor NusG [Clostridia bacterium]